MLVEFHKFLTRMYNWYYVVKLLDMIKWVRRSAPAKEIQLR